MKPLSFLNDSFFFRILKRIKHYADHSRFFYFDFKMKPIEAPLKPYQTHVSNGFSYKIFKSIDRIFGRFEGFIATSAKNSIVGSAVFGFVGRAQTDYMASSCALLFGFGLVSSVLNPLNKIGLLCLGLSIAVYILSHLLKNRTKDSWIMKKIEALILVGDGE